MHGEAMAILERSVIKKIHLIQISCLSFNFHLSLFLFSSFSLSLILVFFPLLSLFVFVSPSLSFSLLFFFSLRCREVATISYRSGPEWEERFARKRAPNMKGHSFEAEYLIETYLNYQGNQWCLQYDPNSLLYISKAMDMFDMSRGFGSLQESLNRIQCPTLILGVKSDILFPIKQQQQLSKGLRYSY